MNIKNYFTKQISNLNQYIIQGERAQWGLFVFFGSVMFFTVCIGHWFVYHTFMFRAAWEQPAAFWGFILPKISISLFLAFFTLFTQRKWWTAIVLACSNLWIIANILYYRANNCVLTGEVILMANNLQGFESSVGFYWNGACTFLVVFTIVYTLSLFFLHPRSQACSSKRIKYAIAFVAGLVIVTFLGGAKLFCKNVLSNYETPACYIPFYLSQELRYTQFTTPSHYAEQHSLIAYLPFLLTTTMVDACTQEEVSLTLQDKEQLAPFLQDTVTIDVRPTYNLIFLLIESLETFAIAAKDINGAYLLPHFRSLIAQNNTLYADKITSQVRHGVSADGQMIVNTGLLPLQNQVAAMTYGTNVYPNYAHFYSDAIMFNSYHATTWNKAITTRSYGYQQLCNSEQLMNDLETFENLKQHLMDSLMLKCYMLLTIASHSPFDLVPKNPILQFDVNMPQMIQDYLTCLHYTDSCFGAWYNEWIETEQAKNTVLVITGDHTIFKNTTLQEFLPYAQQAELSIASGKTYCPLIIQAPQITENIHITDTCYQMDVYPTIMHLIGCEDYPWKGFGVNLLDSTARKKRPITEDEAFRLSDKLIRSNYFSTYFE